MMNKQNGCIEFFWLKNWRCDLLEKCNTICDKISADIKKKEFDREPVFNNNVLKTKIKLHGDEFADKEIRGF